MFWVDFALCVGTFIYCNSKNYKVVWGLKKLHSLHLQDADGQTIVINTATVSHVHSLVPGLTYSVISMWFYKSWIVIRVFNYRMMQKPYSWDL